MKENFIVKQYRGSIFTTQPIPDSSELIGKLSKLLELDTPTVIVKSPKGDAGKELSQFKEWSLVSKDNSLQIDFQAQKIDFLQRKDVVYSQMTLESFSDLCKEVFGEVISCIPQNLTRLAIAPSFKYNGDGKELMMKINSFFAKTQFLGEQNDKIDFSQVYRHVQRIGDKDILLNYFSKFYVSREIRIEKEGFNISSEIVLDFDINTYLGRNYTFSIDDIQSFYEQATSFCSQFIDYYYES